MTIAFKSEISQGNARQRDKNFRGKGYVCLIMKLLIVYTTIQYLLDLVILDDDLSLPDVLRVIHKHYSFSYAKINKEATALN